MACGDQTWDPSLEDKMVRWTSAASEKEIDRAARQLGCERQFKKKKKTPLKAAVEAGVRVHKGSAARIESQAAGGGAPGGGLPGVGANRRDRDDSDAPMLVLPEDSIASEDRAALRKLGVPSLEWHERAPDAAKGAAPSLDRPNGRGAAGAEPRVGSKRRIQEAGSRPEVARRPKRTSSRSSAPKGRRPAPNLLSFDDGP